jgi:hypothetical protein
MMYDLVSYGTHLEGLNPKDKKTHKQNYYEYKQLPKGLTSPIVVIIFGSYVAQIFWHEQTQIILHDDEKIAKNYLAYFNYFWNAKQ